MPSAPPFAIHRAVQLATPGSRGIDCVTALTDASAMALAAAGIEFVVRYLGSVSARELDAVLSANLAAMLVTYADCFDGEAAVIEAHAAHAPTGATLWLDVEAATALDPVTLIAKINAWAAAVLAAGYEPGLYVGPNCLLTSTELYALRVVRYWRAGARLVDRFGALQEPACGWCLIQLLPEGVWRQTGIDVDVDVVQTDYRGRVPHWIVKA